MLNTPLFWLGNVENFTVFAPPLALESPPLFELCDGKVLQFEDFSLLILESALVSARLESLSAVLRFPPAEVMVVVFFCMFWSL